MIPGEMKIAAGEIELNKGRETVTLAVTNTGDRPIQVGSHYHFYNDPRDSGRSHFSRRNETRDRSQSDSLRAQTWIEGTLRFSS